jgi:hypothetical protein
MDGTSDTIQVRIGLRTPGKKPRRYSKMKEQEENKRPHPESVEGVLDDSWWRINAAPEGES